MEFCANVAPSSQQARRALKLKQWSNAELGTPEFFEWLNTFPVDAAERLGEPPLSEYVLIMA